MSNHIIITKEQADTIRGKHGVYSFIEPIPLPDGNFIIPEACKTDPDLISIRSILETMDDNIQDIQDLPKIGSLVEKGKIYRYVSKETNGYSGLVIAIKDHIRINDPPNTTPDLFIFFEKIKHY